MTTNRGPLPGTPGADNPEQGCLPREVKMLRFAATGEQLDPGKGPFELPAMKAWAEERTIRASVLRQLLVDQQWPVHARGVRLRGLRISGHLDLEAVTLRCPLHLEDCYLDDPGPVVLNHAMASLLTLNRCHVAGLQGDSLTVSKDLDLTGSTFAGPLRLSNASIAGSLICTATRLKPGAGGSVLAASEMKVGGEVLLDGEFTAAGTIDLIDAEIAGSLNCSGARLTASRGGSALAADRIRVGRNMSFDRVVTEAGALRLAGASIVGRLDCRGARLAGTDSDRSALVAYGMKVGDDVVLSGGFTAAGGVSLVDAQIAASLTCTGAQLTASHDGRALAAKRMKARNVWLNSSEPADAAQRFTADGAVDLAGADIGGDLNCTDAYLRATDIPGDTQGYALYADGTKVNGDVKLCEKRGKFTATGAILLSGADITGELILTNAFLIGTDGKDNALYADEVKVDGNADLTGTFAVGTVSFKSATVGGSLRLRPRKLAGSGYQIDKDRVALDASGARVAQELEWEPAAQVFGRVILEHAAVGRLTDNWTGNRSKSGFWPPSGRLRLDGLTYTTIGEDHSADLDQRLTWIRSQYPDPPEGTTRFATQPYELLANFYQQAGQDSEARAVAIARRRDLRRRGHLTWYRVALNWVLDKTIRYGYETWRAVLALVVLYAVAVAIFWIAQHNGNLIVPVMPTAGGHQPPPVTQCTRAWPGTPTLSKSHPGLLMVAARRPRPAPSGTPRHAPRPVPPNWF